MISNKSLLIVLTASLAGQVLHSAQNEFFFKKRIKDNKKIPQSFFIRGRPYSSQKKLKKNMGRRFLGVSGIMMTAGLLYQLWKHRVEKQYQAYVWQGSNQKDRHGANSKMYHQLSFIERCKLDLDVYFSSPAGRVNMLVDAIDRNNLDSLNYLAQKVDMKQCNSKCSLLCYVHEKYKHASSCQEAAKEKRKFNILWRNGADLLFSLQHQDDTVALIDIFANTKKPAELQDYYSLKTFFGETAQLEAALKKAKEESEHIQKKSPYPDQCSIDPLDQKAARFPSDPTWSEGVEFQALERVFRLSAILYRAKNLPNTLVSEALKSGKIGQIEKAKYWLELLPINKCWKKTLREKPRESSKLSQEDQEKIAHLLTFFDVESASTDESK